MAKKATGDATDSQGKGETVSGYFRKVFAENPKLLHSRSNSELLKRWLALAQNQRWDAAAKIGRALIAAVPNRSLGWLHHAYALRRATGGPPTAPALRRV